MSKPELALYVHEAGLLSEEDLSWIRVRLDQVWEEITTRHPGSSLETLEELELTLVDDATLAAIHRDFLDDPTVTDVITFPHGEILVSVEMAARRAGEFGKGVRGETFLYLIHGMLHLAGLDDRAPEDAEEMAQEQERIWSLFQE